MATSTNCPACGARVSPGAATCANCGHNLADAPTEPVETPASQPSSGLPPGAPPASGGRSINEMIGELRSRWGVEQTPVFTAALVLAGIALFLGTIGVILWLTAGDGDAQDNGFALFSVALPAALAAAGLLAYLRLNAGQPSGEAPAQDRTIAYVIFGAGIVFTLLSLFNGFDEGLDAEAAWYYYALLFTVFALGFALIARPVPAALAGLASSTAGFIAFGVALVFAVIGALQYRSDDFSTFAMGISLIDAAFVIAILALAWLLGMRPPRRSG